MPVKNITHEYPPTLLIHGDKDTDVPHEQSELMAAELKRHGVWHELLTIQGGEHGLPGADAQVVQNAYRRAVELLAERLKSR
jgi:dipeptidyl aminopeptidase/acylaminoacyl peptidase